MVKKEEGEKGTERVRKEAEGKTRKRRTDRGF